jgi:uncharacterized membrane protein
MRSVSRWAVALLLGGLAVTGCTGSHASVSAAAEEPSRLEAVAGTDTKKVVLTEQAVTRLGLRTAPVGRRTVSPAGRTATRTTVPYSALLYDTEGDTWVYEVVGAQMYLRKKVDVETVEGETVVMTHGPAAGATVVTVGAAMLYGTELGVGEE